MIPILIFAGIAVGLFVVAFASKRRFGLLGLALTAGATIMTPWSVNAGLVVAATGLVPNNAITSAVVSALIVLLPAIVLLFHGYSYKENAARVIGSLLFTVLALAFLVQPLSLALPTLQGPAGSFYIWIQQYRDAIISVGVVLAVIDLFFTKPAKLAEKDRKR